MKGEKEMIQWESILNQLDILKGDILLIASDVRKIGFKQLKEKGEIDGNQIIDEIYNYIGDEGTLIFPTYNWGFCKGETFDYANTISQTGTLTNIALKRDDFIRSKHPIYSVVVKGKYANKLYSLDYKESFGANSIFEFLHQNNGKMLLIDIDYNKCFTYVHYVEKMIGVNYRYEKDFTSKYIDELGEEDIKTYSMYVRDLDLNFVNDINRIGNILEENEIARKVISEDNNEIISIDLDKSYSVIAEDIKNNSSKNLIKYL